MMRQLRTTTIRLCLVSALFRAPDFASPETSRRPASAVFIGRQLVCSTAQLQAQRKGASAGRKAQRHRMPSAAPIPYFRTTSDASFGASHKWAFHEQNDYVNSRCQVAILRILLEFVKSKTTEWYRLADDFITPGLPAFESRASWGKCSLDQQLNYQLSDL